jgi:hypothetical protein
MTETLQGWTPWIVGAAFAILFVIERLRPLRRPTRPGWGRLGLNAAAVALALGVAAVTVAPTIAGALDWTRKADFGLLRLAGLPPLVSLAAGLLLLDLSFYWWHRLNHAWPLLFGACRKAKPRRPEWNGTRPDADGWPNKNTPGRWEAESGVFEGRNASRIAIPPLLHYRAG